MRQGLLIVPGGGLDIQHVAVGHARDDVADQSLGDVQPILGPRQLGGRQHHRLVAGEVVDHRPARGDHVADGAQQRLGIAVGDADIAAAEGERQGHWRGGDEHLHRGVSGPHHVDGGQHVLQATFVGQHLVCPPIGVGEHRLIERRAMDVEPGAAIPEGLDEAGRHHHAGGGKHRREDVVDVLAPLDEARPGRRQGGRHVHVEEGILGRLADPDGQGLAVLPGHLPVPVMDAGGPLQALAEGRRMEPVHRRVRLAVEFLGGKAQGQHRHMAAERLKVALDVTGEAAAHGEHRLARPNMERGGQGGPDLAAELIGDLLPTRVGVLRLSAPGLRPIQDVAAAHVRTQPEGAKHSFRTQSCNTGSPCAGAAPWP